MAGNSLATRTLRKPLGRQILVLLLASTLAFTVACVTIYVVLGALVSAASFTPLNGLRKGIVSGLLFTIVAGLIDYWQRRKVCRRYGLPHSDYAVRQQRTVTLSGTAERAVAQIEAGMQRLSWLYPHTIIREGHTLRAVTRPSLASFSEDVSISVVEVAHSEVAMTITSRPRSIGTILDYGKGIQNVEELKRAIEQWLRY